MVRDGMEPYKERLLDERDELLERMVKLNAILADESNGVLGFELNCPVELLWEQYAAMDEYLAALNDRVEIECGMGPLYPKM